MRILCAKRSMCLIVGFLWVAGAPATGWAWENLLKDPGFEKYHFDNGLGYYVPDANADWQEFGFGRASVRFDASGVFAAPPEMLAEQPLGFSPGAMGFEGYLETQNTGTMIFQQNVTGVQLPSGRHYEAWVWLGGAGLDDEVGADKKDEWGGWQIRFYGNANTATWTDSNALETHEVFFDYYGAANGWVRVSGFGKIPSGAQGFRMRIQASTWYIPAGGGNYNTKVAIDNAHFAVIGTSNLLVNGGFESDLAVGDFTGWDRGAQCREANPSECPTFTKNGQIIFDMGDAYGAPFDSGAFRPYFGGSRAYGYGTWLYGAWIDDAFTFSQEVAYQAPPGTPLTFMYYWIQDAAETPKRAQMREHGGEVHAVLQYLDGGMNEISQDLLTTGWPVSSNPVNTTQYDHNGGRAYNPRWDVVPPEGTEHVRVNVSVMTHLLFAPGLSHVQYAVDEFWLGFAEHVDKITQVSVHSITQNSAVVRWVTAEPRDSRVDYGTTTAYGQMSTDPTPQSLHNVTLTNLLPGQKYFFKISSGNGTFPISSAAADTFFFTVGVGDFDLDGDIDQADYGMFQQCLSGVGIAPAEGCELADLDTDEDVDNNDFGLFQGCMSGADVPFDPGCAD